MTKTIVAILGLLLSAPLAAADLEQFCARKGILKVGMWARHHVDAPFGLEFERRYAIVGKETIDGKDHYWLESNSTMPGGGGNTIAQVLIQSFPYETDSVKRAIMKLGPMEPTELPAASMSDNFSAPALAMCETTDGAVDDRVTTAAGSFDSTRLAPKRYGSEIWFAPEVPFGIVQILDVDGKGQRLLGHGVDAEPSFAIPPEIGELPPDAARLVELMLGMQRRPNPEARKVFEQQALQMTPEQRLEMIKALEMAAQQNPN